MFRSLVVIATFILTSSPLMAAAQTITSVSTDFVSVATLEPYITTIAVYGSDLDYLLFNPVTVELGPWMGTVSSGDDSGVDIEFTIDSSLLIERETSYPIMVSENGVTLATSSELVVFNPFVGEYVEQHSQQFLNNIDHPHKRNKQTIGLNVHQTLGSDADHDALYAQRLADSNTVWVREHISYEEVMGADSAAWLKRYDQTFLQYRDNGQRVVVMLAYGTGDDVYQEPDSWKQFVRLMVKRYRNYVDVWEIWNEPDSDDYLSPHSNWRSYRHILKTGSEMVRQYDPDAIVLNGAIADITNTEFVTQLYKHGKRYFDDLNVHLYYCLQSDALSPDLEQLQKVVAKYRQAEQIWVTEFGCSTGSAGVTNKEVRRYAKQVTKELLAFNNVGPILLYTMRDRTYLTDDPYEAYFGLMDEELVPKLVWRWYKLLPNN